MVNLALFGAGRIGKIHGANVHAHPQACLVGLYDPYDVNANALSLELGCAQMSPDDIFNDPKVDGILVCSATDTHADLIERAVATGKHVFCEKPIDLSIERVRQVVKHVTNSDIVAMVAFNRRFDPQFSQLQNRIHQGEVGAIELVSIISKDPAPPSIDYIKVSGGLFRDMTIHDFDIARFMLSEEVTQISAQTSCLVDDAIGAAGDADTALITLRTASGKLAQISNSRRASFGYDQRIEVHGSQGMLTAGNVQEHQLTHFTDMGVNVSKPLYFFLERYAHAYRLELDAFVQAIVGKPVNIPTMQDGLKALELAEAAIYSAEHKVTVSC